MTLDNIPFAARLFCPEYMSGCDLLRLDGPAIVCYAGDSVRYTLHLDPYCTEPVTWTYDRKSVSTLDSNQTGRIFRFEKIGIYTIKVEKSSCNDIVDSMIVSVGDDITKINLPADTVICSGSVMTLDAGMGYTSYLWQDGTDKESIEVSDMGKYWARLTGENGCIYTDTTIIHSIEPLPFSFLPADTVICAGETWELVPLHLFKSYSWSTGEMTGSIKISNAGLFSLLVVDEHGCAGSDSILVETKKCPFGIYFPNAFTPNKDGLNDIFKPVMIGRPTVYKLIIYNRWGQQIFETTDPGQGWNGMIKNGEQESGTYIWTCAYQFYTQEKMIKKGVFLLLR
jgi:gliding motility-associated-like protein